MTDKPKSVQELKESGAVVNVPQEIIKPQEDTGTAEYDPSRKANITQGQLNTILERVAKLESGDMRPKIEKPKFNTVLIRFLNKKLVVGYGKSWEERDNNGAWRLMTEVKVKDGEDVKIKKVDWLRFRQTGEQLEVKVKSVDLNEKVHTKGFTTIKNVDFANYKTVDTGVEVPMEVVEADPIYRVELPDGTIEELSHEAIN